MSKQSEISRKRGKNFDNLEREVLLECAIENKPVLESKFTNQITNNKKMKIWEETQKKVNALGVASRTMPEVRNKWYNMIQKAKRKNIRNARPRLNRQAVAHHHSHSVPSPPE